MTDDVNGRWLVLLHRVPPKPPYLRAKILRRLGQIGAIPIKRSAYVLPASAQCMEDLQWVVREIEEGDGDAWAVRASFVIGLRDASLEQAFNAARDRDYEELSEQADKLVQAVRAAPDASSIPAALRADWTRARRRLAAIRKIDFFSAPGAQKVEKRMSELERAVEEPGKPKSARTRRGQTGGRIWVTRMGIEEDRMASAWLIRRFIDPAARFRFVDPDAHVPASEEEAFDMVDGEFTHREGRCTFQVLLEHFSLAEPALRTIGEIVHEIDLKDDRYGRPETPGVSLAVEGIVMRHIDDEARLEDGCILFDSLFERLSSAG